MKIIISQLCIHLKEDKIKISVVCQDEVKFTHELKKPSNTNMEMSFPHSKFNSDGEFVIGADPNPVKTITTKDWAIKLFLSKDHL